MPPKKKGKKGKKEPEQKAEDIPEELRDLSAPQLRERIEVASAHLLRYKLLLTHQNASAWNALQHLKERARSESSLNQQAEGSPNIERVSKHSKHLAKHSTEPSHPQSSKTPSKARTPRETRSGRAQLPAPRCSSSACTRRRRSGTTCSSRRTWSTASTRSPARRHPGRGADRREGRRDARAGGVLNPGFRLSASPPHLSRLRCEGAESRGHLVPPEKRI